jgi:cytochrome P450
MKLEDIDLMDRKMFAYGDPREAFRVLREQAPVYWHERKADQGFWCITKYSDALKIYRDTVLFTSAKGSMLDFERRAQHLQEAILWTDPPKHDMIRAMVNPRFIRRALEGVVAHMEAVVERVVSEVIDRGECEFAYDVAGKLPTAVLCEMMAIPPHDRAFMQQIADDFAGATDPQINKGRTIAQTSREARERFDDYCKALIDERRHNPGNDVISDFVHGKIGDRDMTTSEILANSLNLVVAGQETTRNTVAGAVLLMIQYPHIREHFERDPGSTTGIEEVLRYLSPATHVKRVATRDTEIRGQKIREGDKVVIWNLAINYDEEQFRNATAFDPSRTPNPHLAFGFGSHVCLGGTLARLELKAMFEHIMSRMYDFELIGPVERLESNVMSGIKKLPVRFKQRRRAAA